MAAQDETNVRTSMKEGEALRVEGTPAVFVEGSALAAPPAGAGVDGD